MKILKLVVACAALVGLTACSGSKFKSYDGPEVTRVVVDKSDRRLHLLTDDKVLKSYSVGLGFAPEGHKQSFGDGRTPEGHYVIDRRNPNSSFHLSLGISYPNAADIARARAQGDDPGGDIFIHGESREAWGKGPDWTAGCISVKNREIETIYAMVRNGTPITLMP